MNDITDQDQFREALERLDEAQQRLLAASFVQAVLPLSDDHRVAGAAQVAADAGASAQQLTDALRSAKAAVIDSHTRCGSEGDWADSSGYFVARAVVAALTPAGQMPGGAAWQAAMSSRMAKTCESIVSGEDSTEQLRRDQFQTLSDFLKA